MRKSNLAESFRNIDPEQTVFIGVGNLLKGDDGAGSIIARELRGVPCILVYDAETVPENYIGKIVASGRKIVIFLDAMIFGQQPGYYTMVPLIDVYDGNLSTHAPSLPFMLSMLSEENKVDAYVIGIQPESIEIGSSLTGSVRKTIKEITGIIRDWAESSGQ